MIAWNSNKDVADHNIPWSATGSFYAADKLAFSPLISILPGSEANADELNPLAISHTPMNISHKPPGSEERSPKPEPITADSIPTKMTA